jgi:hypothetical protein
LVPSSRNVPLLLIMAASAGQEASLIFGKIRPIVQDGLALELVDAMI